MTSSHDDIEQLKSLQKDATARRSARKKRRTTARTAAQTESVSPPETKNEAEAEADNVTLDPILENVGAAINNFSEQFEDIVQELEDVTIQRPLLAVLTAFSVGIIFGQLFSRK
ncbi:MAG: hypothetical protein V7711_10435 [Pseudomonadales bacterium]